MRRLTLACLFLASPAFAGNWLTDYDQALDQGKAQDKPVLVYFGSGPIAPVKAKFEKLGPVTNRFITVYANKSTAEGKDIFDRFEVTGAHAAVVVERDQKWQYARYLRDLDAKELKTLLERTASAKGTPTVDVLISASAREESVEPAADKSKTVEADSTFYCPSCQRRR